MAQATTTQVFQAPPEKVFKVITDYSSYPEFMSEVKRISIIESQPNKKLVEYEVQVVKTFRYQLWMMEDPNNEISWKFHSGEIFKENSGGWKLTDLGNGQTKADYSVQAKFTMFVPGMLEKKLIEVNLPSMMKGFKERIENS